MTGTQRQVKRTRFAFLTRHIADLSSRRFALAPDEVLKMNPEHRHPADVPHPHRRRHHPGDLRPPPRPHPRRRSRGQPLGADVRKVCFNMANDSGLFYQSDGSLAMTTSTAGPMSADGRNTCRCTRRRCSATSTTGSPPTRRHTSSTQRRIAPPSRAKEHDDPDVESLRSLLGRQVRSCR